MAATFCSRYSTMSLRGLRQRDGADSTRPAASSASGTGGAGSAASPAEASGGAACIASSAGSSVSAFLAGGGECGCSCYGNLARGGVRGRSFCSEESDLSGGIAVIRRLMY
jgi:hypothetical protein